MYYLCFKRTNGEIRKIPLIRAYRNENYIGISIGYLRVVLPNGSEYKAGYANLPSASTGLNIRNSSYSCNFIEWKDCTIAFFGNCSIETGMYEKRYTYKISQVLKYFPVEYDIEIEINGTKYIMWDSDSVLNPNLTFTKTATRYSTYSDFFPSYDQIPLRIYSKQNYYYYWFYTNESIRIDTGPLWVQVQAKAMRIYNEAGDNIAPWCKQEWDWNDSVFLRANASWQGTHKTAKIDIPFAWNYLNLKVYDSSGYCIFHTWWSCYWNGIYYSNTTFSGESGKKPSTGGQLLAETYFSYNSSIVSEDIPLEL